MKTAVIVCITALLIVLTICGSVSLNNYVNRDKPHVYSADELYSMDCSKKGGNVVSKSGRGGDGIYIDEKSCEGAK